MSNENTPQELPAGGPGILPTLLLTTTGRKSGQARTMPLIYHRVDNGFVVVASKGGAPAHPAWYLNLLASRDCEVLVRRERHRVAARTAEGEERGALWQKMVEIYPPVGRCGRKWLKYIRPITTTRLLQTAKSRSLCWRSGSNHPVGLLSVIKKAGRIRLFHFA